MVVSCSERMKTHVSEVKAACKLALDHLGILVILFMMLIDTNVSVRSLVTAFPIMEEFQLYQLFISDLRYQIDRKVLA